jgi:hypothetical protein
MLHINESFIVSVDFSKEDTGVLIVGKQTKGKVDIVNAFQGEEAWDLFNKLTTIKEKK